VKKSTHRSDARPRGLQRDELAIARGGLGNPEYGDFTVTVGYAPSKSTGEGLARG
jgi:hypothetical protein